MVLGLDTRFLGRKWQKKNEGYNNGNGMSCFALKGKTKVGVPIITPRHDPSIGRAFSPQR